VAFALGVDAELTMPATRTNFVKYSAFELNYASKEDAHEAGASA
jgi:hypothetical protein